MSERAEAERSGGSGRAEWQLEGTAGTSAEGGGRCGEDWRTREKGMRRAEEGVSARSTASAGTRVSDPAAKERRYIAGKHKIELYVPNTSKYAPKQAQIIRSMRIEHASQENLERFVRRLQLQRGG